MFVDIVGHAYGVFAQAFGTSVLVQAAISLLKACSSDKTLTFKFATICRSTRESDFVLKGKEALLGTLGTRLCRAK